MYTYIYIYSFPRTCFYLYTCTHTYAVIQKRITETSKIYGKPCVIATQMMESMIENPTPTRAEASDCAVAVFDSADAVMLSAESAAGKYPIESVTMQQLIINKVESDEVYRDNLDRFAQETTVRLSTDAINTAITLAARQTADISKSKVIVAFTSSGMVIFTLIHIYKHILIYTYTYTYAYTHRYIHTYIHVLDTTYTYTYI